MPLTGVLDASICHSVTLGSESPLMHARPALGGILPSPSVANVTTAPAVAAGAGEGFTESLPSGVPQGPLPLFSLLRPPGRPIPALRGSGSHMHRPACPLAVPLAPQSSPPAPTPSKPRQPLLPLPGLRKRPPLPRNPKAGRPGSPSGQQFLSETEHNGLWGRGNVL